MSRIRQIACAVMLVSPVLLSACGGGGGASGANGEKRFVAACTSKTNMPQDLCECVAKKARNDLSKDGFAMLLATLEDDRATADALRRSMKLEEVTQADEGVDFKFLK